MNNDTNRILQDGEIFSGIYLREEEFTELIKSDWVILSDISLNGMSDSLQYPLNICPIMEKWGILDFYLRVLWDLRISADTITDFCLKNVNWTCHSVKEGSLENRSTGPGLRNVKKKTE